MAGSLVPIIRKTQFKFGLQTGTANNIDVILEPLVDTIGWVSGVLLVRAYSISLTAGSGTPNVTVKVVNAMTGPDDPNTIVVQQNGSPSVVSSVSLVQADASLAPLLYTAPFAAPISRYTRVIMTYVASVSATTAGDITLAVDLLGRDA